MKTYAYFGDISVTKLHDGSFECATVLNRYLVHQRYFGYSQLGAVLQL